MHGNSTLCGRCRRGGKSFKLAGGTQAFGVRRCDLCGRRFTAKNAHQRFCSRSHERLGTQAKKRALYADPRHKLRRKLLEPLVATGAVRCAAGEYCKHAEELDGELVGGFIRGKWDLGHPDAESEGGPEHRECNRSRPMRLRAGKARNG
jgi:hypothetical protein